jgi:hypothetical protein
MCASRSLKISFSLLVVSIIYCTAIRCEVQKHQRPLDRPSLTLVEPPANASTDTADSAADWFMMGGGDLAASESRRVRPTRRMAEMKRKNKFSNRTTFDDDQVAESNDIHDDIEEGLSAAGTSKEPECASHGRYYCTFKEDYPLKLVTEVTKYYKWPLEKLFRDLHAQIMPKLAQDSSGNLVCDSVTRVVRPGWARNTNERWLVVINTENYHQYVTEVVCQYGTNSRCNFIPPCYYSSCQQRYNTQKLLVIDPSNPYRGPFLSEFLFPSCCVCYVPSTSESIQDKYRPSPATIYQRTMQQEATSNLNPPQFRSAQINLLEEALSSASNINGNQEDGVRAQTGGSQAVGAASGGGGVSETAKQPAPGEIRRGGEQYRRAQADSTPAQSYQDKRLDADSFPRLGLVDSLATDHQANAKTV